MKDGIIVIKKQKVDLTSYQILEGYNDIFKEDDEIRVFSDDVKKWRVYYLPKYDNLIFICIKNEVPYKVLEFDESLEKYIERKPDFKDYFLADFIIEEDKMLENYKYEGDRCIGEE